ncbi:LuxR C-terminal-related transcriptional regulator [Algiphilus sp.]|uniref:response regulator transcription factor n=1 Tax=Algiphilus sp. TaxID=1872431 RepID=UPI0032EC8275
MSVAWNALAEIGKTLAARPGQDQLYQRLVEVIRAATGCEAVALSRANPLSSGHETLYNMGYPAPVLRHLNTWFVVHDEVYRHMRTNDSRPLRWRDMPFPYETMHSAVRVFIPAGFREGVTTCLYNDGGEYTGALHLSASSPDQPSDDIMRLLNAAQTIIGSVADWRQGLTDGSLQAPDATSLQAVRNHSGNYQVLADGEEGLRTTFDTLVAPALPDAVAKLPPLSFLARGRSSFSVRIHPQSTTAIVELRHAPVPFGLTARELEVSTLLIRGLTNPAIARCLGTSVKTASHHVENVIHKLDGRTRTEAAIAAERLGLVSFPLACSAKNPCLAPMSPFGRGVSA